MKEDIVILHRLNSSSDPKAVYWGAPKDDFDRGEDGYYHVRDAVWKFLIDNKVDRLPVDLSELYLNNGWMVIDFQTARPQFEHIIGSEYFNGGVDCFTIFCDGKIIVVYNEELPIQRLRYSLAHELAHIVLKHNEKMSFRYDAEADMFASRLLMPLAVIKACKMSSAEEIADICEVSLPAAQKRFERLKKVSDRNKFLSSDNEKKVVAQFADFIRDYLANIKR